MKVSDLPDTAVLLSPGVWDDAPSWRRFYLDPSDAALLVERGWTDDEVAAYHQSQATAATERAALLAAIGERVALLRPAAAAMVVFAAAETERAALVAGIPLEAVTIEAIRSELALAHTDLALVATDLGKALADLADLAIVVSGTL